MSSILGPGGHTFTNCCGLQTLNPHSGQINNAVGVMPAHTLAAMATTPASVCSIGHHPYGKYRSGWQIKLCHKVCSIGHLPLGT